MNLSEVLRNYNVNTYGKNGDIKELAYEDIIIDKFVFSHYELDVNNFLEVVFKQCDFTNVYLGSLCICGSIFEDCIFESNTFNKGKADYAEFINTKIINFNTFRTEFCDVVFKDSYINNSSIDNCDFRRTTFSNCIIENVIFRMVYFNKATFKAVKFVKCSFLADYFTDIKGLQEIEFIECIYTTNEGVIINSDFEIKNYINSKYLVSN